MLKDALWSFPVNKQNLLLRARMQNRAQSIKYLRIQYEHFSQFKLYLFQDAS